MRQSSIVTRESARSWNQFRFRHSSRNLPLKLSMYPFSVGLPGVIKCSLTPLSLAQAARALLVNSGPLSTTSAWGSQWVSLSRSSTRTTRWPVIDVSTSMAGHSRVNWSTMVKALILLPPTKLDKIKIFSCLYSV